MLLGYGQSMLSRLCMLLEYGQCKLLGYGQSRFEYGQYVIRVCTKYVI